MVTDIEKKIQKQEKEDSDKKVKTEKTEKKTEKKEEKEVKIEDAVAEAKKKADNLKVMSSIMSTSRSEAEAAVPQAHA